MKTGLLFFSKRTVLSLVAGFLVVAAALSSVQAETVTVSAVGKDAKTAAVNAQVNAVRSVMNEMIEPSFQKSHVKELRQIIASPDVYSDKAQIITESAKNKNIQVEARVEVKRSVLEEKLKSLGAKIVKSYKVLLAERTEYEQKVLDTLFGKGGKLSVTSTPYDYSELGRTEPVSEETFGYAIIGPTDKNEFAPEEDFVVSFFKQDEDENRDFYAVVVDASLPVGSYVEGIKSRFSDSDYLRMDGVSGLLMVKAPVNPGSYEVRMYSGKGENAEYKSRWGFKVRPTAPVPFRIDRDVFAPSEKIRIHFDSLAGIENYQLRLVKEGQDKLRNEDMKEVVSRTKDIREENRATLALDVPKEEGNYELVLIANGCRGYCHYTETHRRSYPVSHISVKVKNPVLADETMLLIPAEIPSGSVFETFLNWPKDTEKRALLKIFRAEDPVGDPKVEPLKKDYLGNTAAVIYHDLTDLFEPGDYRVELCERDGDNPATLLTKEFRVLPGVLSLKPQIELSADEFYPSEDVSFSYTAAADWSEHAFVALVPEKTVNDAKQTYDTAKSENRIYLNHKYRNDDERMHINLPAGVYELRMYDRDDEKGRLQAKKTLTILSEQDEDKHQAEIDSILDDALGLGKNPQTDDISAEQTEALSSSERYRPVVERVVVLKASADRSSSFSQYDRLWWYADEELPAYRLISECTREEREAFFGRPEFIRVGNFKEKCDSKIDDKIKEITRLDLTLGRDNNLGNEVIEFGKSLVMEWPHGFDSMQKAAKIANDTFEHGTAGLDALSEGDYTKAAKEAGLYMIKTALNSCDSDDCYFSLVGANQDSASTYFASLSDEDFMSSVNRITKAANTHPNKEKYFVLLAQARGRLMNMRNSEQFRLKAADLIGKMHDLTDAGIGVTEAVIDSEADEGTKDFVALDNGVVKTNSAGAVTMAVAEALCRTNPKCSMLVSTAKLAYQTKLAVRDFVRDSSVLSAYSNWQKFEGTDAEWLVKAGGVRGLGKIGQAQLLEQVKNIMSKTARTNKMTQDSLSATNKSQLGAYKKCLQISTSIGDCDQNALKQADISDDEAWSYLYKQFAQWDDAERGKEAKADYARKLKDEFKGMDSRCRANLEFYVKNRKDKVDTKTKIFNYVSSWFEDACVSEGEMFDAYMDLKATIEKEYRSVLPPLGVDCWWRSSKALNTEAVETLCESLESWRYDFRYERKSEDHKLMVAELDKSMQQRVMETIADRGCECGVSLSVVDGHLYPAGHEPMERMKNLSDKVQKELEEQRALPEKKRAQIEKIKNYSDEGSISHVMDHIGRRNVLHCLCSRGPGHPAIGGGTGYSGGKCHAMGVTGHTWTHPMASSEEAKRECGYYDAIDLHVSQKSADDALKPMISSEKDLRAKMIEDDPFLQLRKASQCKTRR